MQLQTSFTRLSSNSVLGDIVRETYRFMHEGEEDPNHEIVSPTDGYRPVRARDYFLVYGPNGNLRFLVRPERLPLDLHVRSVVGKNGKAMVETSKIDFPELSRDLESMDGIEVRGRSVFYRDGRIIESRTENVGDKSSADIHTYITNMDIRTLMRLLPEHGTVELDRAMEVVDRLDSGGYYVEAGTGSSAAVEPKIEQILRMDAEQLMKIRQELAQFQIPVLAIRQETRQSIARRKLNAKVLAMGQRELAEFIRSNPWVVV